VLATKTTDMTDGFGPALSFNIQDDAGVINPIGKIGAVRDGADNTGAVTLHSSVAGTFFERMRIASGGNVGIGTATPSALLHINGNALFGGTLTERGRSTPLGEWIDVAFNASDFSATSGSTWNITSGSILSNSYTVIGKTMIWVFAATNCTVTGTAPTLTIALPGGFTCSRWINTTVIHNNGGSGFANFNDGYVSCNPGSIAVTISRLNGSAWSSVLYGMTFTAVIPVQ